MASKTKSTQTATETTSSPSTGPSAKGIPCLCGCGAATTTDAARFLSGHDAKLRKAVLAAAGSWDAVPVIARPFFLFDAGQDDGATAGLALDDRNNPRWLSDAKADRKRRETGAEVARLVAEALAKTA
jgi:hypothetical protein